MLGPRGPWAELGGGNDHSCGRQASGSLWCWGDNGYGQLGTGSHDATDVPVQVARGVLWLSSDAGGVNSCAIQADETLWCWGDNSFGQVGDGTVEERSLPTLVRG